MRGWKGLLPDDRRALRRAYRELLEKIDWDKYGVVDGVARDPRCENCMMHCGYEPTAASVSTRKPGDTWKTIKFNFGARPRRPAVARNCSFQRREFGQRPYHRQKSELAAQALIDDMAQHRSESSRYLSTPRPSPVLACATRSRASDRQSAAKSSSAAAPRRPLVRRAFRG